MPWDLMQSSHANFNSNTLVDKQPSLVTYTSF
jgi:hypothetical protein